jgi:hypothetical protein
MRRSAIGLAKDAVAILPADKKEAVSRGLEEADKQLRLAEASIADALGYALCRCAFPPTPMLLVGYRTELRNPGTQTVIIDIHQCPYAKGTMRGAGSG